LQIIAASHQLLHVICITARFDKTNEDTIDSDEALRQNRRWCVGDGPWGSASARGGSVHHRHTRYGPLRGVLRQDGEIGNDLIAQAHGSGTPARGVFGASLLQDFVR
jgi:hypothetical protein